MQTLEQPDRHAADLYWLAYLLTGHRVRSLDVTVDTLGFRDGANPFFATWMLAWSRRVVIAKALTAIREELAVSVGRTAARRAQGSALPRNWALGPDTTKVQLERALLAIDVFPRCALVLLTFEGVALDDAATLLDSDREMVRKAQVIGLWELTCNLARMQGWTSSTAGSYVMTSEMQHA